MPQREYRRRRKNDQQLGFLGKNEPSPVQLARTLTDIRRTEKATHEPQASYVPSDKYRRTVDDLRNLASMFWPSELSQKEAELSVIPRLLETQDQFIAILSVDVLILDDLFQIINSSKLPANMFVKHLTVIADFGGEMLQRVNSQFGLIFPASDMKYLWNGKEYIF